MAKSPEEFAHLEWIGYVQPVGLVVSVPAMLEAQCYINKNIASEHAQFLKCLLRDQKGDIEPNVTDFKSLADWCFGWDKEDLVEVPRRDALEGDMASLEVVLPQYQETLRPTYAVPTFKPEEGENPWQMLVQWLPAGTELDEQSESDSARHWQAAPQLKFERLLRETGVSIGILSNEQQIRLVYAPRGESSGYVTFRVSEMMQVAGRPMFAAMHMLLSADRMFTLGDDQRLPAILENSRKYQSTVSTKLAEQVLEALYELIRGFQAANDDRKGELLKQILEEDPNQVYSGLLNILMRLVFVLYAEDRDLMSSDSVYTNHYSITGLFERLREDKGRFPDTMDSRYGAWSQLITLFRLVFEGGQHGSFKLAPRKGYLFDPDRYPFLEGRTQETADENHVPVPRVSDGVVYRVLRNLLILDGERLSYRTLDVEQIGSVYETIMGFNLEVAEGKSIAIKPTKSHGAPSTINLEALLETPVAKRAKFVTEITEQKITGDALRKLKEANSIDGLLEALDKKVHKGVTPNVVAEGAMILQPSDERRRSGSHYTPRSLTEPIVRTTLEPILKQLYDSESDLPVVWQPTPADKKRYTKGEITERQRLSELKVQNTEAARKVGAPHPNQILDLKICDPAMGSGAFLVEACRQLGDELIQSWHAHDLLPDDIPADEDEVLYARRLVAQRCLYGVDKNVMAVDLAKLSLWLVTLARDHAFTFLDHSFRHGDSLVGLTREQIIGFHWELKKQKKFGEDLIQRRLDRATESRAKILNAREDVPYRDQQQRMASADESLDLIRLVGDACVSGFFAGQKKTEREEEVERIYGLANSYLGSLKQGEQEDHASRQSLIAAAKRLSKGEHPIPAFHWEIEFPEVFARENGGFDAFVGNPPFAGHVTITKGNCEHYTDYLRNSFSGSGGKCDLVAFFFRQTFNLLRQLGTLGLLATKTVRQGDTRESGLQPICLGGGVIYDARRRYRWPGQASVIVSVIHIAKTRSPIFCVLDGKSVSRITSFLFTKGGERSPQVLRNNESKSFEGTVVRGMGFTFDDNDSKGVASPMSVMRKLINQDPRNAERIFPFIGGADLNDSPNHTPKRQIINFGEMEESEARRWPDLFKIVEDKVLGARLASKAKTSKGRIIEKFWQYGHVAKELYEAIEGMNRVMACGQTSKYRTVTFLPTGMVYDQKLILFRFDDYGHFAVMQSQLHVLWARFFGSTMKDDPVYTPTDCFDPFPFPRDSAVKNLIEIGEKCFSFRAKLMVRNEEGLTNTYNRFHDPHEQSEGVLELRSLHELMDAAVLRAYGWDDLAKSATCEFLLDYEEEENNEAPSGRSSRRRKPWRYRWPDDFRDEVLARLLELNEQRHKEELLDGTAANAQEKSSSKKKAKKQTVKEEPGLFKSW